MARLLATIATLAIALTTVLAPPAAVASGEVHVTGASGEHVVALGDSAAAGPGILPERDASCRRSTLNVASRVATTLDASAFTDVTCTGATVWNLTSDQVTTLATEPPQLDALRADTTLVMLGPIGANDAGIIPVTERCLVAGCKARDGETVHSEIESLRGRLASSLTTIRERSPHAAIVVVGYGQYLPPGGCPGTQPLTPSDSDYIQSLVDHLDVVLEDAADAAGATFADQRTTPGSADHTGCAAMDRWLEGPVPIDGSMEWHPTLLGMEAHSATVIAAARVARAKWLADEQARLEAEAAAAAAAAAAEAERVRVAAEQARVEAEQARVAAEQARVAAEQADLTATTRHQLATAAKNVRGQLVCRRTTVRLRVLRPSTMASSVEFRAGSSLAGRDSRAPFSVQVGRTWLRKHPGALTAKVRLSLRDQSRTVTVKIHRPSCARA